MSTHYESVVILYNPKSTGKSKLNALELEHKLRSADSALNVQLRKTEHAGHGEDIARQLSVAKDNVLLLSSSGDGGYNELVNGVLQSKTASVVVGVIPSGNANDHYTALHHENLVENIINQHTRSIDTLKVTSQIDGKKWERYAHSYVGLGLSPVIGKQLTDAKLNFFNEKWLVVKYLFKFTHVSIKIDNQKLRFSSLVFSNIPQMSKVMKLTKQGTIEDGKFEISALPHVSKIRLLSNLLKSVTFGLEDQGSHREYSFETTRMTPIQLDGEVYTLDAHSETTVTCIKQNLKTVL